MSALQHDDVGSFSAGLYPKMTKKSLKKIENPKLRGDVGSRVHPVSSTSSYALHAAANAMSLTKAVEEALRESQP